MKLAFHSKEPRLTKIMVASRPNELDADLEAASRSINARSAFDRKDKKTWFRIDLAGQALNAVWRGSMH